MLSLHVVRCIIEWRKQLIYNFLLTNKDNPEKNNIKKFKNIPFIWENENYLLKMKSDTSHMLYNSHFSRYFHFSNKNDPFLVNPSMKTGASSLAQGGGAAGIKRLKGAPRVKKLQIPLQAQLMKIIRQSEVYLMEEAVTDHIVRATQLQVGDNMDPMIAAQPNMMRQEPLMPIQVIAEN